MEKTKVKQVIREALAREPAIERLGEQYQGEILYTFQLPLEL